MMSQVKKTVFGRVFLSVLLILTVMIGVGAFVSVENGHASAIPDLPSADRDAGASVLPASGSFAPLVKKAAPAVVSVQVEKEVPAQEIPQAFRGFPGFPGFPGFGNPQDQGQDNAPQKERGAGSGVIVSPDGYIVTNHHVVDGADKVKVQMSDDRTFDAKVIGSDAKTDIAVIKIDANNLPVMKLGNSDAVEVGDIVLAIGNPFGLGQTVTMGIVGATGRAFGIMAEQHGYEDFIQTDAAINPGNSGGALVNTRGELIGVNSAIISRGGGNDGVGFAIPVNLAHNIMKQLVDTGHVSRGYMGVQIQAVTPEMTKALKIPDSHGAVIASVEEGSPADKAGLKRYDVVRSLDGKPIHDQRDLSLQVASTPPGHEVKVEVLRDGQPKTLALTLTEFPEEPSEAFHGGQGAEAGILSGVTVDNLTPDVAKQLGFEGSGVVVTQVAPNSAAAEAGLQRGDVIQEVNRQSVTNLAEFRAAVKAAGKDSVLLLVTSKGGSHFVVIEG